MKYLVIKRFTDLQDNNFLYELGAEYPRDGYEPTKERIKELATEGNRRGEILIKATKKTNVKVSDDTKDVTIEDVMPEPVTEDIAADALPNDTPEDEKTEQDKAIKEKSTRKKTS